MKYCWKKLPICSVWFLLFISISLFGQDPDAAWKSSVDIAREPPSKPEIVKKEKISLPVIVLPGDLLPRLAVKNTDVMEFQKFLTEKDTGIFKLWNDLCGGIKIIDVAKDGDCLEYSDYAFGSQFSLDLQRYSNINSNIILSKNNLSIPKESPQEFQILMDLGNQEFSKINKKTKEVVELSKIKMIDRFGKFQISRVLANDELKRNKISNFYPAESDHIFLLRSVFWDNRGDFSWQRETIYVFQMVKLKDNIATIIWKKINSKWV